MDPDGDVADTEHAHDEALVRFESRENAVSYNDISRLLEQVVRNGARPEWVETVGGARSRVWTSGPNVLQTSGQPWRWAPTWDWAPTYFELVEEGGTDMPIGPYSPMMIGPETTPGTPAGVPGAQAPVVENGAPMVDVAGIWMDGPPLQPRLIPDEVVSPDITSVALDLLPYDESLMSQPPSDVLVSSMERFGLLQPIVLIDKGDEEVYSLRHVAAGRRRIMAARQLGWDTIPARVFPAGYASAQALTLVENEARGDNTRVELWSIRELMNAGTSEAEIRDLLRITHAQLERRRRLLALPEPLLNAFFEGTLSYSLAVRILALPMSVRRELATRASRGETITSAIVYEASRAALQNATQAMQGLAGLGAEILNIPAMTGQLLGAETQGPSPELMAIIGEPEPAPVQPEPQPPVPAEPPMPGQQASDIELTIEATLDGRLIVRNQSANSVGIVRVSVPGRDLSRRFRIRPNGYITLGQRWLGDRTENAGVFGDRQTMERVLGSYQDGLERFNSRSADSFKLDAITFGEDLLRDYALVNGGDGLPGEWAAFIGGIERMVQVAREETQVGPGVVVGADDADATPF